MQGWIRNTKNSECIDCRKHKRYMTDVPDYAALFTDSGDELEEFILSKLKNPPEGYKLYFDWPF
tara:strand:- start:4843 stop:5034 length:192 start_codon:yes stop_codon:yes gene_type:complete